VSDAYQAETFLELKAIVDRAAVFRRAFKPLSQVSVQAGLIQAKAGERIGVELAAQPKAQGTRGQGRPSLGGSKSEPPKSDVPTLAEMGVDRKFAAQAQKLAELGTDRIVAIAADLAAALAAAGRAGAPSSRTSRARSSAASRGGSETGGRSARRRNMGRARRS
jgi:hypothetical protein